VARAVLVGRAEQGGVRVPRPIEELLREAQRRGLRVVVADDVEAVTALYPDLGEVLELRPAPVRENVGEAEAKASE
jgi:hypothetical protein